MSSKKYFIAIRKVLLQGFQNPNEGPDDSSIVIDKQFLKEHASNTYLHIWKINKMGKKFIYKDRIVLSRFVCAIICLELFHTFLKHIDYQPWMFINYNCTISTIIFLKKKIREMNRIFKSTFGQRMMYVIWILNRLMNR